MGFLSDIAGVAGTVIGGHFGGAPGAAIGGAIGGAISGSSAANDAADAAREGEERRIRFLEEGRAISRGDLAPYRAAGETALDAAMSLLGLPAPNTPGQVSRRYHDSMRNPMTGVLPPNVSRGTSRRGRSSSRTSQFGRLYDRARAYGGPTGPIGGRPGRYKVGEHGPEMWYRPGQVPTPVGMQGPEVIETNQPGYIQPNPISATPENPGGQPGRYNFMTSPGYNFRYDEGARALERNASARGRLRGGAMDRALVRYGQGVASDEYARVYDRIAAIAGLGANAASAGAGTSANLATHMGAAAANAGAARASGYLGSAASWQNAGNSLAQTLGQYYPDVRGGTWSGDRQTWGWNQSPYSTTMGPSR